MTSKQHITDEALRGRLIEAMKNVFEGDQRRIAHALSVLGVAEEILRRETANRRVVQAAAILHDIGIHEAHRKHGSTGGRYQELEGPPIARPILDACHFEAAERDHVLQIIANHHSVGNMDTVEFRILWDADWLVNIPEEFPGLEAPQLRQKIDTIFKTPCGKSIALETYIERNRQ